MCGKRDLRVREKRPIHMAKETYSCGKKRPACVVTEIYQRKKKKRSKRGLKTRAHLRSLAAKIDLLIDLRVRQKRPIHMAKETYSCDKRDLLICSRS